MTRCLSDERLDAARDLAEAGYGVFPCRARGKAPLTTRGFKDATRDERTILHWFDRWPDANIAVACGASGIAVVDVDSKAGAHPAEILPQLPNPAAVSWTGIAPAPSDEYPDSLEGVRGAHVFYRWLARTGRTRWPGVEVRSRGAYVIVAPSAHPSGVAYEWAAGRVTPVHRLPDLPSELADGGDARNGTADNWGAPADPGEPLNVAARHDGLLHVAGSLLMRRVYEPDLLTGALLEANRRRCRPPKPEAEVRRIAEWAASSERAFEVRVEDEVARRLFKQWRDDESAS